MVAMRFKKEGICKSCGKTRYIYAKKKCGVCYWREKRLNGASKEGNSRRSGFKRYVIPSRKKKPTLTEKWLQSHWGFKDQVELFKHVWDTQSKKCPLSAVDLRIYEDTSMFVNCFAHILPKGKYPLFKLNPANIMLINPHAHKILDQGSQIDRVRAPYWKFEIYDDAVEDMKKKYEKFKQIYLL